MSIVLISGSPSLQSRSGALLASIGTRLRHAGFETDAIGLSDVPADDLVFARHTSDAAVALARRVARAEAVVVATPVYKASLSGGLKALLDLLPPESFGEKPVLPLATGGSAAHQLALDFGLKPVLSALGARHILAGVYACDAQVELLAGGGSRLSEDIAVRVERASVQLLDHLAVQARLAKIDRAEVVPLRPRPAIQGSHADGSYVGARCSA